MVTLTQKPRTQAGEQYTPGQTLFMVVDTCGSICRTTTDRQKALKYFHKRKAGSVTLLECRDICPERTGTYLEGMDDPQRKEPKFRTVLVKPMRDWKPRAVLGVPKSYLIDNIHKAENFGTARAFACGYNSQAMKRDTCESWCILEAIDPANSAPELELLAREARRRSPRGKRHGKKVAA